MSSRRIPNEHLLPALDVPESPLRRAAVNTSMTQLQDGSKADLMLTVFNNFLSHLREKPAGHGIDNDSLDPKRLAAIVKEKVQHVEEFAEQESLSLKRQHEFIRQVSSGRNSRATRSLTKVAEQVVNDEFSNARQHLLRAIHANPFTANQIVEVTEGQIEDLHIPDPNVMPLTRLTNIVRFLRQLKSTPGILPEVHRGSVEKLLAQRGESLADEALSAACLGQVATLEREAVQSLRRLTKDLKSFIAQFQRNVAEVRTQLEDRRRVAHHRDAASKTGIEIVLSGPDEASLIAAMLDQAGLSDPEDLTNELFESFHAELSETAKIKYPTLGENPPVGQLLTRMTPSDIAAAIQIVIDRAIGTRHTVYSALRGRAIREFASELLRRASVLVHLGGYQHELFHIQPIAQVLVRFPHRVGDEDEQIYKDLLDEITTLFPAALFEDAGEEERDIKCVRTLIGFPYGVEEIVSSLQEPYSTCHPHPPHLYGIVSKDGQPITEICSLHSLRLNIKTNKESGNGNPQ